MLTEVLTFIHDTKYSIIQHNVRKSIYWV